MFKLTVCLLLCTAVFSVEVQDYFENCVRSSGNHFVPNKCIMYPRHADEGCTLRLEFLTAPGDCKNSNYYFPNMCPPANDKITGVCQAQLFLYGTVYLVERSWCEHVNERCRSHKKDGHLKLFSMQSFERKSWI
ncbi:hypothetical protein MRX96_032130 [Rhipicephalus microplus]